MPHQPHPGATRLVVRLQALLAALREAPLTSPELLAGLGAVYPPGDSGRRMLDRDIRHLAALGVVVERAGRPRRYTLLGGAPAYSPADLRALALIRDAFDPRHPQAAQVAALLARLTAQLAPAERRTYARSASRQAPLRPAIDYAPFAERIEALERAIAARQLLDLRYRNARGGQSHHPVVEPIDIEFYERHFYLVAYSRASRQIHDFRVDRILSAAGLHTLPPGATPERPLIAFRYRLAAALAQGELSQRFEAQRVVERLENGDVIVEAEGRSDFFIIQTLLRYRDNAELLGPPWLRAKMAEEVRRLAALYADTPRGGVLQ